MLLGFEFLEHSGIVLDITQRGWFFGNEPDQFNPFLVLSNAEDSILQTIADRCALRKDERKQLQESNSREQLQESLLLLKFARVIWLTKSSLDMARHAALSVIMARNLFQKSLHCVVHFLNFKQSHISAYHPEANSVERRYRDLKTQLAIWVANGHSAWSDQLPTIRFSTNSSLLSTTCFTPAYLKFGRELRTPDDVHRDLRSIVDDTIFVEKSRPIWRNLTNRLPMLENYKKPNKTTEKTPMIWSADRLLAIKLVTKYLLQPES